MSQCDLWGYCDFLRILHTVGIVTVKSAIFSSPIESEQSQSIESHLPLCLPIPACSPYIHYVLWCVTTACFQRFHLKQGQQGQRERRSGMYRLMWCVLCHGCVVDRWSSDEGVRERPVHLQWPSVGLTPTPAFPKGSTGVTITEPGRCSQQLWEYVLEGLNGWWLTSAWLKYLIFKVYSPQNEG